MTGYVPRISIVTAQEPDKLLTGRDTKITVDGNEWPTFAYRIEGDVNDIQRVTLTFAARVEIINVEPPRSKR